MKFFIRLTSINKNNLEMSVQNLIFEVGRSLDAVDNCGTEMNKKKAHHPHGQCTLKKTMRKFILKTIVFLKDTNHSSLVRDLFHILRCIHQCYSKGYKIPLQNRNDPL